MTNLVPKPKGTETRRIDAHVHVLGDHSDTISLLDRLNLKLLNNTFGTDSNGKWRTDSEWPVDKLRQLAERHPDHYGWLTGFDLPHFDDPEYAERTIARLDLDFAAGSVGCKVWKNIGLEVRKPTGEFLMVDDQIFEPIFAHLERLGRPLLMHIGEPQSCWRPLDESNVYQEYYRAHPEWHLYNKPGYPSHTQLIAARDRVIQRHPKLRVIGAHLGSLECDLAALADRFERYPNFCVDVSARITDLVNKSVEKVRQLFSKYSDRILYGTDCIEAAHSALAPEQRKERLEALEGLYGTQFAFFESNGRIAIGHRTAECLALAESVLEKFYVQNAIRCYPGL